MSTVAAQEARGDRRERGLSWTAVGEKGSILGIRVVLFAATVLGRRAAMALLHPIVLYFVLVHGAVRRASVGYLRRVLPEEPGLGAVYRHVLCFAKVTVDRVFMLRGRDDLFDVGYMGHPLLEAFSREGRGAILLSAHVGSRSAMELGGQSDRFRIHVVGRFGNTPQINRILAAVNPRSGTRLVDLDPTSPRSILALKEMIADGCLLAMTADRTTPGDRCLEVPFLGGMARFPLGPFLLASLLDCPMVLVFALYDDPNRYELYCEEFHASLRAERRARGAEGIEDAVRKYASRLEAYCRAAPYNWFNFYDFWGNS